MNQLQQALASLPRLTPEAEAVRLCSSAAAARADDCPLSTHAASLSLPQSDVLEVERWQRVEQQARRKYLSRVYSNTS